MYLTDEEKRMLQGEEGVVRQKCMEQLVDLAEIAGAERLVDLDGTGDFTHVAGGRGKFGFPLEALRDLAESGAKFKIPTCSNKVPIPQVPFHGWEKCGIPQHEDPAYNEKLRGEEYMSLYRKMGVFTSHSCANYLTSTFWPTVGQHCSWTESSAVPYCNAVLGGRVNLDGSFASCFLGKAPYYGMHITENRRATVLIKAGRPIQSELEWDVYGFAIGELAELAVPAVTGTVSASTSKLVKFNAALNTGGSVPMYHIPGVTPEAPTVEFALSGKQPRKTFVLGETELRQAYEKINYLPADEVDFVFLGCPHYNIVDLWRVSQLLEGKKVKVRMWIMTSPWLYDLAKSQGFLKIFEDAGATLLTGTCPAAMGMPEGIRTVAMDSAKQSYYITGRFSTPEKPLHVCYGSKEDCVQAALTGKWRGDWR
ncbi:MAG: aconitase X catalytic domain-containing protein [Peptococcaceae bacterium]|jgi:predicted aconitase|nr:aconitase X catalytic domain-containing protein [Peptococcaceae bacterium]